VAKEKNLEEFADEQMAKVEQLKKDYITTFASEAGKRVLADLEQKCFLNRSTFPENCGALNLARNEGMRFVVVYIKNMMKMNIEHIKKLVREE
jgi:hypothetical protein